MYSIAPNPNGTMHACCCTATARPCTFRHAAKTMRACGAGAQTAFLSMHGKPRTLSLDMSWHKAGTVLMSSVSLGVGALTMLDKWLWLVC